MIYRFAQYTLDTDQCEIRCDDVVVALEAQVYAVLAALIENRSRILSKKDLIDLVWAGRIVSDSAIASRIHAARAVLGDDGQKQATIKTFSGQGYRFIAQLRSEECEPRAAAGVGEMLPLVDVSRPVPGFQGRPAIVVMPFEVMSDRSGDTHIAAGLAEEVSMRIALWRTFPVIAGQSALTLFRQHLTRSEVGRNLGVRYLVEGSFRRSGPHLRIGVRLISADTGYHLWDESFHTATADIFALQDEIADEIVGALEPELVGIEFERSLGKPRENLDAWQANLRGMWHLHRSGLEENAAAIRSFQAAIRLDRYFGPAFGGLCMAYVFQHGAGWAQDQATAVDAMAQASEQAIRLAPSDPQGHIGHGWSKLCRGDFDAALESIQNAVTCNPSAAIAWYYFACALCFAGQPEAALLKVDKALRLSPRDPLLARMWGIKARCYYGLGEYEKAINIGRAVTASSTQIFPLANRDLAASLISLGRVQEAREQVQRLIAISPGYSLERAETTYPWKNSEHLGLYLNRLRSAGLE